MTSETDWTIRTNSEPWMVRNVILDRLKLVPPFNTRVKKFKTVPMDQVQDEHIPLLGVYMLGTTMDGGPNNMDVPKFATELVIGFSYVLWDNDEDDLDEQLDVGFQSIMKLLHDPNWHQWPNRLMPSGNDREKMIQAITRVTHVNNFGLRNNGNPVAEMRVEWTVQIGEIMYQPVVTDIFEDMHFKAIVKWPDDPDRQPVIADWVIPQN
jgi:hypothetical protein